MFFWRFSDFTVQRANHVQHHGKRSYITWLALLPVIQSSCNHQFLHLPISSKSFQILAQATGDLSGSFPVCQTTTYTTTRSPAARARSFGELVQRCFWQIGINVWRPNILIWLWVSIEYLNLLNEPFKLLMSSGDRMRNRSVGDLSRLEPPLGPLIRHQLRSQVGSARVLTCVWRWQNGWVMLGDLNGQQQWQMEQAAQVWDVSTAMRIGHGQVSIDEQQECSAWVQGFNCKESRKWGGFVGQVLAFPLVSMCRTKEAMGLRANQFFVFRYFLLPGQPINEPRWMYW